MQIINSASKSCTCHGRLQEVGQHTEIAIGRGERRSSWSRLSPHPTFLGTQRILKLVNIQGRLLKSRACGECTWRYCTFVGYCTANTLLRPHRKAQPAALTSPALSGLLKQSTGKHNACQKVCFVATKDKSTVHVRLHLNSTAVAPGLLPHVQVT